MTDCKNEKFLEFNKIFEEQVKPYLERKESLRKAEFSMVIFLLSVVIGGFVYLNFAKSAIIFFSWLAVAIGFIFYVKIRNKKFANSIKKECLPKLITVFDNMFWQNLSDYKGYLSSNKKFNDSGLFPLNFNEKHVDDEFSGKYRSVQYKIEETKLVQKSRKSRLTLFRGIVISFKSNKKANNRTIVSTKGDLTAHSTKYIIDATILIITVTWWFINPLDWHSIMMDIIAICYLVFRLKVKEKEPMNKVTLEDPLFTKRFNVYSSDQVEARYLLTTAFMERFYNLKTTFGARMVKCSFFDDNFMVAIHTRKNLFELGDLFHSLTNPKTPERLYNEICSILNMVEYFKLDENTGL